MPKHHLSHDPFFRLGRWVHRRRWLVIAVWLLAVLVSTPAAPSVARSLSPGGFSTLERHEHMHGVLILRGSGHCLVGDEVKSLGTNDLVTIAPMTWHQFRASKGEPLGFLCMVNAERDRPQLPTADDIARLRSNPAIAAFLDDKT